MQDLKHLGTDRCIDTPLHSPAWGQALLAVCAFAVGVLVNQHFTDEYVAHARKQVREARAEAAPACVVLSQMDIDAVGEDE